MKWSNLKEVKCPQCDRQLTKLAKYACMNCHFTISSEKFDNIVNKMYRNPRAQYHEGDNSSLLNNFGHEEVKEDFSDSPFLNL